MKIKKEIEKNLKEAMKEKDPLKINTIRLTLAAIKNEEIAKKRKRELKEEELQTIIQKEIKKRKDAIEAYRRGRREELAQKEEKEIKVLQRYLPEPISEPELEKIIQVVIEKTGAKSAKDLGKVMGPVMARVKGKADGKLVNEKIKQLLS